MLTITKSQTAAFNRVEIAAGQYWRAKVDVHDDQSDVDIPADMVLLILSIRRVDNKPHTIILRPHPSMVGRRCNEHRFLLKEFGAKFTYEPDFQRFRDAEIAAIQKRISDIQSEITGIDCHSAAALQVPGDSPGPPSPTSAAAAVPATVGLNTNFTPEILRLVTPEGVQAMRAVAEQRRDLAVKKADWIKGKTDEISAAVHELVPYFQERADAALAQTEDVQAYANRLLTGVESLDLYCGKGVKVTTICKGSPAPAAEPLSILQKKLYADEEIAVYTQFDDGNFDYDNEKEFFKALVTTPQLRNQIFISPRCILVMAWRRTNKTYCADNPTINAIMNTENKAVWILARNGDNIYRINSPVESHLHSSRLFPSRNEIDGIFCGVDGESIKWEDIRYTDALSDHEDRALHYKRFLILMTGLQDRLNLFGNFYDKKKFSSFLSLELQERHFRFIHDEDSDFMLPGEKREKVSVWIQRMNSHLLSGSRIICLWKQAMTHQSAPGAVKLQHATNHRSYDYCHYSPDAEFGITIAYKEGNDICVGVQVSGETYIRGEGYKERSFEAKVNLSKIDTNGLSHLCLDAAKPEEINWFIHNRDARVNYMEYLKFFKAAYEHLESVVKHETDTRARLRQALLDGNVTSDNQVDQLVDQAVMAWRAVNRGTVLPVPGDLEFDKAFEVILNQIYILAGHGRDRVRAAEELAATEGRKPLRLVVTGRNKLVLYAEPLPAEREDRLFPHCWVQKITLEERKSKVSVTARTWSYLLKNGVREHVLKNWPWVEPWILDVDPPATPGKIQDAIQYADQAFRKHIKYLSKKLNDQEFENIFASLKTETVRAIGKKGYVVHPEIAVPLGVYITERDEVAFLSYVDEGYTALFRNATDDQKAVLRSWFVNLYKNKEHACSLLKDIPNRKEFGNLCGIDIRDRSLFIHKNNTRMFHVYWDSSRWTTSGQECEVKGINDKIKSFLKCLQMEKKEAHVDLPWRRSVYLIQDAATTLEQNI